MEATVPRKVRRLWSVFKLTRGEKERPWMGNIIAEDALTALRESWKEWPELKPTNQYRVGRAVLRLVTRLPEEE